jgi:capsular exopolysaccharide synthesis family protein
MRTLYVHRASIIVVFTLFVATGIILSFFPRNYEADGALWVEPGEASSLELSSLSSLLSGQTNDIVASEVTALQSRTLFLRVAKELDLVHNRQFWGSLAFLFEPNPQDRTLDNAVTRDLVYKKMSHVIEVENSGKDEVINISAKTISPTLSAKIVNTLINDYLEYLFEMRYGATKRSSGWLIDQLGDLKKRVDKDQEEITQLQEKLGLVGVTPGTSSYIYGESLSELMKASDDATIERIVAEAKLRYMKDSDPNLIEGEISLLPQPLSPASPSQSLLQSLRASQAQTTSAYARLLSMYGPNFPEVKQAKAQLDDINSQVKTEEQRIVNQAQLAYNAASANEKMSSANVQQEKSKVFDSRSDMVRFVLLMQDYSSDRSLYQGLIQNLQEAGITAGLQAGDIDIVDLADVPGKPTILGPLLYLPGGVILGLILGITLALWLGTLDQRIEGPEQVEKITRLPLLAQAPHVKIGKKAADKGGPPMLIVTARRSHYAEAMQSLRASLLLAKPGSPPKVILITSSTPNEGKSTTSLNVAATFAHHGARVLIIDCDLRRGTIAHRLLLSAAKGLTSVLTHQIPLDAAIQEVPTSPGLWVLTGGPLPPDPSVLIGSDEMRKVLDQCKEMFDFVFIDSPPILGMADGVHLGQLADSVVLVVRERLSRRKAVLDSANIMSAAHLPVSGFVFNDVDPRAADYGYGYAYRQYYRGGYYNDDVEVSE